MRGPAGGDRRGRHPGGQAGSTSRAAAAFRVLDRDGTGYLDTGRLAAGGTLLGA
ncbi:hypothetical protein ACQPW3_12580 [Actinosynnema sp. CA-248983]